jgi:phosphoglycerate kinase
MAYTFLKAKGEPVGKSLVEEDKIELAKELMASMGEKLMLPIDHAVSPEFKGGGEAVYTDTIPEDQMALDIGPETLDTYTSIVNASKTIIWNGPMGVFEMPPFDFGTVGLAKAVAESGAISVVGGGDSEKAIKTAGVSDRITHISTGGGASLEFLSGIELPGVAALTDKIGG